MQKIGQITANIVKRNTIPTIQEKAAQIRENAVIRHSSALTLTPAEAKIVEAMSKPKLKNLAPDVLTAQAAQVFKFIAADVGIHTGRSDWQFMCTRLLAFLTTYYGDLSFSDIKQAFEFCAVGELDEYLPRDRHGNPDKSHYQQFNVEYFAKILNAYKAKSEKLASRAYKVAQSPLQTVAPCVVSKRRNDLFKQISDYIDNYDAEAADDLSFVMVNCYYDLLSAAGLSQPCDVCEEDLNAAYAELRKEAESGMMNQYEATILRAAGTDSEVVRLRAVSFARKRALNSTIITIKNNNINIMDYAD